jgi:hypothetical protein
VTRAMSCLASATANDLGAFLGRVEGVEMSRVGLAGKALCRGSEAAHPG